MKNLFPFIFCILSGVCYSQSDEWHITSISNEGVVWYVKDVKISDSIYDDWDYDCYMKNVNKPNSPVYYTVAHVKISCSRKQLKLLSFVDYDTRGKVLRTSGLMNNNHTEVYPDSNGASLLEYVCPKP